MRSGHYLQFVVIDVGQMNLAQYIREVAFLTGTKVSCGEGGCGACIVTVNKEGKSRSVNSVSCFYRKYFIDWSWSSYLVSDSC